MGGLGKTRLAQQIGADVLDTYPDGVWFVDLAPIRDPSLVTGETAQVLGIREEPGRPLVQTLCSHLKSRNVLLILDNCEHLVSANANLANTLLRAAPEIRILATSREALHVPGERVYPLLPLPVPDRADGIEALTQSPSVQLFVERARSHKPSFSLTEREAPAIAELVARLEGIPLALELAAARVRSLSVADINIRLKDRYKLLTGGGRVLMERQQTLRALVDWSYDLLQEKEQRLLARLAVFAGGFTLPSTEEICGADPLAPEDVLDLLSSLVDKSLVMVDEGEDGARYRMLETIREYAREKLLSHGEMDATRGRHCDHFLAMAKASNRGLQGPEQPEWTRRTEAELDNMRAAIAWGLEGGGDPILSGKFEVALLGFWMLRGYGTEGRDIVRRTLRLPAIQASNLARAHTLYAGAALADNQSDYAEARQMLEQCLVLRRGLGEAVDIAATLSTLSLVRLHSGDADGARAGEEEALQIFRQIGDRTGEAIGLLHLGQICAYVTDDVQARHYVHQCLAISREIGHLEMESECERMLGELALEGRDLDAAYAHFANALAVSRNAGDKRGEATAIWLTGRVDLLAGDTRSARIRLGGALRAFRSFEMYADLVACIEDLAALDRAEGLVDDATRLYAAAANVRERLALVRSPRAEVRWKNETASARRFLGDAAYDAASSEGRHWEIGEAVRRALSHVAVPVPA
jgi:non-specific serine/threonine protein kinase